MAMASMASFEIWANAEPLPMMAKAPMAADLRVLVLSVLVMSVMNCVFRISLLNARAGSWDPARVVQRRS
jgi:hypothetical protein